jgi:hypothetical protein
VFKSRASKGLLVPPNTAANDHLRSRWVSEVIRGFVSPSSANKEIYAQLLNLIWPVGHGIPGPIVSQQDLRSGLDEQRRAEGKSEYKDVFRRLRELQGEEGLTCIVKEGTKYQIQSTVLAPKRIPRQKPTLSLWKKILTERDFACANCGAQQPSVRLSPDHRIPRDRGGDNSDDNWQPLCEQCNNIKSSACRGCELNCRVCSWAFPETYKQIRIDDSNKELIRRQAEKKKVDQSKLVNEILRTHFNSTR